jgi:hypothetical protein
MFRRHGKVDIGNLHLLRSERSLGNFVFMADGAAQRCGFISGAARANQPSF